MWNAHMVSSVKYYYTMYTYIEKAIKTDEEYVKGKYDPLIKYIHKKIKKFKKDAHKYNLLTRELKSVLDAILFLFNKLIITTNNETKNNETNNNKLIDLYIDIIILSFLNKKYNSGKTYKDLISELPAAAILHCIVEYFDIESKPLFEDNESRIYFLYDKLLSKTDTKKRFIRKMIKYFKNNNTIKYSYKYQNYLNAMKNNDSGGSGSGRGGGGGGGGGMV